MKGMLERDGHVNGSPSLDSFTVVLLFLLYVHLFGTRIYLVARKKAEGPDAVAELGRQCLGVQPYLVVGRSCELPQSRAGEKLGLGQPQCLPM